MLLFALVFVVDPGNYEIHLPDSSLGYVSFSDISPNNDGFTICFWLKTEYSGFFIEYKGAASKEQNATLVLGVYCGDYNFNIQFGDKRRYSTVTIIRLFKIKGKFVVCTDDFESAT